MKQTLLRLSVLFIVPLGAMERTKRTKIDYAQSLQTELLKGNKADAQKIEACIACSTSNRSLQETFSVAVSFCLLDVCEELLKRGVDLEAADANGWTPLMVAVFHGHIPMCDFLISHGAKLEATDIQGQTPLMIAAQHSTAELCRLLVQRGAQVNVRSPRGQTVLMLAGGYDYVNIGKTLMDDGADLLATDRTGLTALALAARKNNPEACRALITHAFLPEPLGDEEYKLIDKSFLSTYLSLEECFKVKQKDIVRAILLKKDLAQEWAKVTMTLLAEGKVHKIPKRFYEATAQAVTKSTLEKLKGLVKKAQKEAWSDEISQVLNEETLETRYGKELEEQILKRIKAMAGE